MCKFCRHHTTKLFTCNPDSPYELSFLSRAARCFLIPFFLFRNGQFDGEPRVCDAWHLGPPRNSRSSLLYSRVLNVAATYLISPGGTLCDSEANVWIFAQCNHSKSDEHFWRCIAPECQESPSQGNQGQIPSVLVVYSMIRKLCKRKCYFLILFVYSSF